MDETQYLSVAYYQPNMHWEDTSKNLEKLKRQLDSLETLPEIIVLPELYTTGFSMNTSLAEPMNGESVTYIQNLASKYNVAICGSFMIKEMASIYNRFLFFSPETIIASYDKKHLFTPGNENQFFNEGVSPVTFDYKGWKFLPTVCYDIRFPVWCRNTQHYHVLLNCANWPATRTHIWHTLLQARAIENQAYCIGVNRIGKDDNKIDYNGGSCIINARGEFEAISSDTEDFKTIILDKKKLLDFRQYFPVLRDADPFQLL